MGVQVLGGTTVTWAQMVTGSPQTDGLGKAFTEMVETPWPTVIDAVPVELAISVLPP
ncbi:hypothetical protein ACFV42_09285 [Streptomyces solisilvae]|uniref:hypothetical protein n=1 Tax=Streptomyces malaysiensis TaxID=92644 RepID=UPI0036C2B31D